MIEFLSKTPKIGQYFYHYKHNHTKDINNYAYIIVGIALHSETEELLVAYKPLYKPNHLFDYGANFVVRPLEMFVEDVDNQEYNYKGPRFRLITDEKIIAELMKI
jgi:hypothetical protein